MGKKISIVLGAIAAVVVLGLGMYHSDASPKNKVLTQEEITDLVTSQYPGDITKLELNDNQAQAVYHVAIKGEQAEYELQMDAKSGEVLNLKETRALTAKEDTQAQNDKTEKKQKDSAAESDKQNNDSDATKEDTPKASIEKKEQPKEDMDDSLEIKESESEKTKQTSEREKKTVITKEEAIEIALSQFSGEVDDVDLDEEDGRLIYEIEIERGDLEAEIEIDAYTGEVIVMEIGD